MELWEEILSHTFADFQFRAQQIMELRCYQTLEKIKAIIQDDSLDDETCFWRIEKIICALEDIGSGGGSRHDF